MGSCEIGEIAMSLWGKVAGVATGYALGGVPGAIVGGLFGHFILDRFRDDEVVFTIALIALAAKMTRADGVVSPIEVEAVQSLLQVPEKERRNVERVFRLAQEDVAGFDTYAKQIADLFADSPQTLEDVLDALFIIAYADGSLHPAEQQFLDVVANIFSIDEARFRSIQARHCEEINDPYTLLGVDVNASDKAVRDAYLDSVRRNHPDQMQSRGVPPEMLHIATARMSAINEAWELIRGTRNL
jgi:DnaJ like chaperone protein